MRISYLILIFLMMILNSCIEHKLSSDEVDDIYFTKKDVIPIEEEELKEVTEVEEVK